MQKTTQNKKSSHVYDYVIVGGGLTGLCLANVISQNTTNVLLIEASDSFGGYNRSVNCPIGPINNGLRFIPESDLSKKALDFLASILGHQFSYEVRDSSPITYENGHFKPFVGFGDQPPEFYNEINYFNAQRELVPSLEVHEWISILFNGYRGDFLPKSHVTKFLKSESGSDINAVMVNGQKQVLGKNFIYAGDLRGLATLLPEGSLGARTIQKLQKGPYWTAICLDLIHNQNTPAEENVIHVLNGTTQDEVGPCVGQFKAAVKNAEQMWQHSRWMSFLANEEAEEEENIANALKKIKRQVKRAYPESLDSLQFERILVVSDYSIDAEIKLNADGRVPNLDNLWIAHRDLAPVKNIVGSLLQAQFIASSIGMSITAESLNADILVRNEPEMDAK